MAEIQRHVAEQPAVLRAWTFVKNKFVDLDKKYEFRGLRCGHGNLHSDVEGQKMTSNFTFTRGSCRAREQHA